MLETFGIVITQVAILFVMIAVGFFLCKKGILNDTVRQGATTILLSLVTPCVIISKMQAERTAERLIGFAVAAAAFALYTAAAALLSLLFARRKGVTKAEEASKRICMIYSNCGFMGLPLLASLSSILGDDALFYGSVIIGVNNLFIFTQGIAMFTESDRSLPLKTRAVNTVKTVISPAIIAVIIGAVLFFSGITLPAVISQPISYLGSMNTPLAMLIIGAIIYNSKVLEIFRDKRIYLPVIVKNLIFPLMYLGACFVLKLLGFVSNELLICLVIISCPVAGNCAIFSERYGGDSKLASGAFSLSTIASAITLPVIIALATALIA